MPRKRKMRSPEMPIPSKTEYEDKKNLLEGAGFFMQVIEG
ncbi:hypothetical protein C723_1653 [Christiangramia flava JLT2011]|uniref:Uncharacterized protein n=1 Tax=Christiangramia flava JLT2011 TaxID=1229726 RepID=A0A1L7IAX7_9FLAO|nr:hypothetical protein GRFL_3541 [Christiangramia flava JLT2011]OSS39751.1 hypothetical protein C723_1653 [Christiangramia flava JLT2011]